MSEQMTRRGFVSAGAGVGLAALLAACGGSSSSGSSSSASSSASATGTVRRASASRSATRLTLQLSWLPSVEWAGIYMALAHGYDTAAGLEVTILPGGPNVSVEPLLAAGKVDVGMTYGVGTASANKNGAEIRIFGGDLQTNPNGIASLASAPISSPKQLEGKKLGVSTTGTESMKAFLSAAGVDVSKVTFVPVQSSLQPLADHQVDGFGCYQPDTAPLTVKGIDTHFLFRGDFGPVDVEDAYGATTQTIEARRGELQAFMHAQQRGWQTFLDDPKAAATEIVAKYGKGAGLTLPEQKIEAADYVKLVTGPDTSTHGLLWLSPATRASAVKAIVQSGTAKVTSADVFDTTILTGSTAASS